MKYSLPGMIVVLCLAVVFTFKVFSASFNCKKAGKFVEYRVCANPLLNRLDNELGDYYQVFLKKHKDKKKEIQANQLLWLNLRDKCKRDECIEAAYKERIRTLKAADKDLTQIFHNSDGNLKRTLHDFGTYIYPHDTTVYNPEKNIWEDEATEDCLEISKIDDRSFKFSLFLSQVNGHSCGMEGTAVYKKTYYDYIEYEYTEPYNDYNDEKSNDLCILDFEFRDDSVTFRDRDLRCRSMYCGMRAGLDGVDFPLSKKISGKKSCRMY